MITRNILLAAGFAMAIGGCTTDPNTGQSSVSNTGIGAGIGAAAGAGTGALVGGWKGALIGAGIGAAAGAGIGYLLDEQEREFNERLAQSQVNVSRDDNQDAVLLTLPAGVTFQTDSSTIQPGFRPTLDEIALTMNEYPNSRILISGHTDSTGTAQYNQQLSQQRADAVANYLISRNVSPSRITSVGAGESQPVASNETDSGRAANRRVEIRVVPQG